MSKKINDLPLVAPTTEDTYVVYDQSTGNAARVAATPEERMIDLNAGGWLLDKNGNEIVSKDDKPIVIGDVVPKPLSSERAHVGLLNNITQDMVHEFGVMSNAANSWANNHVTVGGMTFRWSQNGTRTGFLRWQRAANCTAHTNTSGTGISGTCHVTKYANNVSSISSTFFNYELYTKEWTGDNASNPTFDATYQTIEWFITDLSASFPRVFRVKAMETQTDSIVVLVEYFGPKVVTLRGL